MIKNVNFGMAKAYSSKMNPKAYQNHQERLANNIVDPNSVADLRRNAAIKLQQVQLARAQGDFQKAAVLNSEYQAIVQDINKSGY